MPGTVNGWLEGVFGAASKCKERDSIGLTSPRGSDITSCCRPFPFLGSFSDPRSEAFISTEKSPRPPDSKVHARTAFHVPTASMNDPSHYPSEQPGLEVGVPSVQHQYAGHNKAPSPYDEAASKEAIPYRQQAGLEPVPPQPPPSRVCGLPKRKFWIVLALGILVIGAALGGGLGGGLSGRHRTATGTPEQTTSSSAVSASTTASTTASTAAATSSIQPFNTSPGTYRIVNVATNTAIDLLNGGTTNDTEIECWQVTVSLSSN